LQQDKKTSQDRKRLGELESESQIWKPHWSEIAEYVNPRKGRFLVGGNSASQAGKKKGRKIINSTGTQALRVLAAGLQGGMTPPDSPWLKLGLHDEELEEYAPVRNWLHDVRNIMLDTFQESNFYSTTHSNYRELGAFGTCSMVMNEDFKTKIRCRPFTIGEYMFSLDESYRVNGLYRPFDMSVANIVAKFGKENVSSKIKDEIKRKNFSRMYEVVHVIRENQERDGNKTSHEGQPWVDKYFEKGNKDHDVYLSEKSFHSKPFAAARWDVTGIDPYGEGPGMDQLGDIKMLQKLEEKKLKALDKSIDPSMNGPVGSQANGGTGVSGGINWVEDTRNGFVPTHLVQSSMQDTAYEIDRVERRIEKGFYNDLFMSIIGTDKKMTAYEVAQRHAEKLVMLGPVIFRIQSEYHTPAVERSFNIHKDLGAFPPMPEELQGQNLKIKYISPLAQAQRMVGIDSIQQTMNFAMSLAEASPEVLDKIDFDEAVDQFGDMAGTPPKIVKSDDVVKEVRQLREQKIAAQQQQEQIAASAQNAKTLSETKVDTNSLLDGLTKL
tara:strand:+ start:17928 stop:19583 length:1656 start_codon:yes stop_codon:yes gene_type:complete